MILRQVMFRISRIALLGIYLTTTGCFNVNKLSKGQHLYAGGKVVINQGLPKIKEQKALTLDLQSLLRPKPNSSILGLQPKLWLWSISKPNKKGLNHFLHDKLGEAPVLFNPLDVKRNSSLVVNHLQSAGFFQAQNKVDTVIKKSRISVLYKAFTGPHYMINQVVFPDSDTSDQLSTAIHATSKATLLKKGLAYNLELLKAERIRIDAVLKNQGFYYFSPEYLLIQADSSIGNHRVNLEIVLKDETPDKAGNAYRINHSLVYSNFTLAKDDELLKDSGRAYIHGFRFIDPDNYIRPGVLESTIFLKQGEFYNRDAHNITLSRLVNLGVYKFVKATFKDNDTSSSNRLLNASYFLTPFQKYSLKADLTGSSKSDNNQGGVIRATFRDRNFNKTANLFSVSAYAGFEAQISGAKAGSGNSLLYGASADLYVPRFVTPFHILSTNQYVPKTRYSLSYDFVHRAGLYSLRSGTFLFGYTWKESARKDHQLYPISITYVHSNDTTAAFSAILKKNRVLQRSFESQFFIGSTYTYTYSDQLERSKRNNFYFNGSIDLSGNLIGAIQGKSDTLNPHKLFGNPYAQYAKIELDTRDYLKITPGLIWANRVDLGFGYTHGNSGSLPYVKAFFSGGSNSIRAFRARSVGPGSSTPLTSSTILSDAPGDIKIEANSELRTNLFSIVKGAAFIDAGNVWLLHADQSRAGSRFSSDFLKQLAVGTGLGVRLDVSFFVLRLDVAFPLRIPYLPDGNRWVINKIDFGSAAWRRDNLVYNIAIGYPF